MIIQIKAIALIQIVYSAEINDTSYESQADFYWGKKFFKT